MRVIIVGSGNPFPVADSLLAKVSLFDEMRWTEQEMGREIRKKEA